MNNFGRLKSVCMGRVGGCGDQLPSRSYEDAEPQVDGCLLAAV